MKIVTPRDDYTISSDDDKTRSFSQQLCQFKDCELRRIFNYLQDDLLYIVENISDASLLRELGSRNITDAEKYQSLENKRRMLAPTLVQDIFKRGRKLLIALLVSLHVFRKKYGSLVLDAVLEELRDRGNALVEEIIVDECGHQLSTEIKELQNIHKKHLLERTKILTENKPPRGDQKEESFPFCTRYVNLIIVSTDHFRQRCENELIETGVKHEEYLKKKQSELQRITLNKLFRWCHQSKCLPRMVMVSGVPGVGKTTLMQKFVYDWVKGDFYQRFSFVFFFKFRELNRLDKVSLETMIFDQYPYMWEQLDNILQEPEKLLFIFDGLDESVHNMDFTSSHLCSNPKQLEPCGRIVISLVRKSLLEGCSVLMTSRPTKLASIDCTVFQRIVEITGFLPEERRLYFNNFFSNPELAEKAFNYVKQNETLYTFCYLPSYCWIICTVLSKSFQATSSDQSVSLLPKTVTQLFAIFVANILSNHSLHKGDAQKILQSIGWMAEYGVMNHMIIFDEQHLDSFHVDNKSKLLSSFLIESEESVTFSFLHLTVQEFLSALVHYADFSSEKLQKSLKKAKSYSDGRGEIFLRFLCGLSDGSTLSFLTEYLDKIAAQASIDVITWVKKLICTEERRAESENTRQHLFRTFSVLQEQKQEKIEDKQHLLSTFFYLFETRNKVLVQESLQSRRSLDLSGLRMSALDCTVLAFILDTCTDIEELILYNCSLDAEGLERLTPAMCNLQILSLCCNNLPDTSCAQLASVIRKNQSLKRLDLSGNNLSGPHLSDLMEALSNSDCRIEELCLSFTTIQDTYCIQLASVIRNKQSLKRLDLSGNRLYGDDFSDLMEALSSPDCRIEKLLLSENRLPNASCKELASGIRNNQSLRMLDLSNNRLPGPNFSDLMKALSSPFCRIEELYLGSNDLPDTSCIDLASGIRKNQSLKIIDLSNNFLFGPDFSDLMEAMVCRIEEINLSSNNLLDSSCIQLASLIGSNQSLKKLDLSNNRLHGPHFSDLMEALSSSSCRIEELRLGNNNLLDTSCSQLASLIRNNQSLKKLDLCNNGLHGPPFVELTEALSSSSCRIEELQLGFNNLPNTSCSLLASLIRSNQSLKKLDLSNNSLSGPHFSELMKALSSPDCRIEELQMLNNGLSEEQKVALRNVDRTNMKISY